MVNKETFSAIIMFCNMLCYLYVVYCRIIRLLSFMVFNCFILSFSVIVWLLVILHRNVLPYSTVYVSFFISLLNLSIHLWVILIRILECIWIKAIVTTSTPRVILLIWIMFIDPSPIILISIHLNSAIFCNYSSKGQNVFWDCFSIISVSYVC